MPLSALLLALAAASAHALWNLLLARARDPEAATAVALLVAVAAFAPVAVAAWDVDAAAWPWIGLSAAFELAYFALLAAAYRRAELGLVYPLARGLAPVFVLTVAAIALGVEPTTADAAGIGAIAVGVLLVRGFQRPGDRRGTLFAVAVGGCIAGYTLVDAEGVRHAAPLPYLEAVLVGPALAYAFLVARLKGYPALGREVGAASALAGLAMFGAYALVLAALERAEAAPVAAVRETSVVIAAVLAAAVLREPLSGSRLTGAAAVAAGVAILALG